ncbi:MFS transporter [Nocardioides iriomotensis]|uniref:Tetracycline resistance protein n=1 Tax=Nocardioides iriomotensis TaxID=715784 RepID=A0A4Q5J526_9ACTN|nr:MFS transporter [Nocardioides iriomotensis]RYU13737.1 MFS transporter [Nocardioides iriomotensis]
MSESTDARRLSLLVGVLFGLAGFGSASAAIVLPVLADDLGVSTGVSVWAVSLYALFLAVATAVYGRVSDLVGVRTPFTVGIVLMTVGAVAGALAPSFGVLLAARVLQGAGAAAVPTLGIAAITARYGGDVRTMALGRVAGLAAAVNCLGPLAGGAVEAVLGWRAVIALPVAGIALLPLLWRYLPTGGTRARLDVVGAVLVAATSGGLIMLVQSPSTGATVALVGGLLLVLGVPAVSFWVRRRPHGFLPLSVLSNGTALRSAVAASSVPAAWFALLISVPTVLITVGWEPWQVGLALLPSVVTGLLAPRLSTPLVTRLGASLALVLSGLTAVAALGVAAVGAELHSATVLVLAVVTVTFAFGVGQPALMTVVSNVVAPDVRGVALGLATLMFLAGGSVGSAVVGGLAHSLGMPGSLVLLGLVLLGLIWPAGRLVLAGRAAPEAD